LRSSSPPLSLRPHGRPHPSARGARSFGRFGGPNGGPLLLSAPAPALASPDSSFARLPPPAAPARGCIPSQAAAPRQAGVSASVSLSSATAAALADDCPICYVPLRGPDVVHTSCAHAFHGPCLYRWFGMGRRTCPSCRHGPLPEAAAHQPARGFGLIPDLFPDDDPVPDPLRVPLPDPGPVPELSAPPVPSAEGALGVFSLLQSLPDVAPARPVVLEVATSSSAPAGSGASLASPADSSRWWRQGSSPVPPPVSASLPPSPAGRSKRTRAAPSPPASAVAPSTVRRSSRAPRRPRAFWLGAPAGPHPMVCDSLPRSPSSSPLGSPPRARHCPEGPVARGGPAGGQP
jgi:hypothetical protein